MSQRLQAARLAAGLSQSQLARAAGVPVGTLQGWEQGRRTPLADVLPRLAGALGCGYEDILGPPETPAPAPKKGRGKGAGQ